MSYEYNEEELRSLCRTSIEALERWARIIIDQELSDKYGKDYFDVKLEDGNSVIKQSINDKASKLMSEHPDRYSRKIDALLLDDIISILCNPQLYRDFWGKALNKVYPEGREEVMTFLKRLVPIRNNLSHANPISARQAERAICYSNDFIDGVKQYMLDTGKGKIFNVPHAIRLNDSLGNEFFLTNEECPEVLHIKKDDQLAQFCVGDKYSLWVTMDPSFPRETYDIRWEVNGKIVSKNEKLCLTISEKMVGESSYINCRIIQKKAWHKYTTSEDHRLLIVICVLPPIE